MNRFLELTALCAMTSAACFAFASGGARTVQRTQSGGVIALEGDRATAATKAREAMTAHCGRYEIVEEREVVVGSEEVEEEHATYRRYTDMTHKGTTTRDLTEYRITYRCVAGARDGAPGTAARSP